MKEKVRINFSIDIQESPTANLNENCLTSSCQGLEFNSGFWWFVVKGMMASECIKKETFN